MSPAVLRRQFHLAAIAAGTLTAGVACSGDEDPSSTLGPIDSTAVVSGAASGPSAAPAGSTLPAGPVGSGFVSIQVRLGSTGVEEAIALDRATVAADDLEPISLDARCTALDGGEGLDVSVTDLHRLAAGKSIVSARLHVDPPLDAAGTYDGSLEIGDGQQVVTTYTGSIVVDEGLSSGSFDVTDESGGVATGTFVCADQPVATTTVPASGGGEQIPGASAVVTAPPVSTLVPVIGTLLPSTLPVIETLPPGTLPVATS